MVKKFIAVVVTGENGSTAKAVTSAPVLEDATSDVSIVDNMGLQSDGTGIIGDVLRISYGASFGTPTAISWYRNGAVLTTVGSGNTGMNVDGGTTLEVTAARGAGTYKATVVADGKTYETNEIIITNKEEQGKITAFSIEDDYTDGTDVDYDDTDNRAIITVTLSKNYAGTLGLYKKTDAKYTTLADSITTRTGAAAANATAANVTPGVGASLLSNDAATNYQMLNLANNNLGAGVGYYNSDGSVTYKFVADDGLVRGTEYVVTFDQDSIFTDTPNTGTANVFGTAVAVPYVKAPASIKVTKVSNGNKPEVTFYDADGNVMKWFGYAPTATDLAVADENGITVGGTTSTLRQAGIDEAQIYSATSKTNDTKTSGVTALAGATQVNPVKAGVWTSAVNADDTAYWFAQVKTLKGIFAADAATITSEAVPVANDSATDMDLTESKTTATSAVVEFENLRAAGTVYVVRGSYTISNAGVITNSKYLTTADIYSKFDANDPLTYTAKADVAAGAKTVEVANAIGKYTGYRSGVVGANPAAATEDRLTDQYIAVFIPSDDVNYGMIYTDAAIDNTGVNMGKTYDKGSAGTAAAPVMTGLYVAQEATSIKYDPKSKGTASTQNVNTTDPNVTDIISGTTLLAYDQFGERMVTAVAEKATDSTTINSTVTTEEKGRASYSVAANGRVTVNLRRTTGVDKGDGFNINVLGSTIKMVAANEAIASPSGTTTTGASGKDAKGSYWKVTIGDDTVVEAATAGTIVAAKYATAAQLKTDIEAHTASITLDTNGLVFDENITIDAATTLNIPEGYTLTINGNLVNNGTIQGKGTLYLNGNLTNTGTINLENNSLRFTKLGATVTGGGIIKGHAVVEASGSVNFTGNQTIGGAFDVSGGFTVGAVKLTLIADTVIDLHDAKSVDLDTNTTIQTESGTAKIVNANGGSEVEIKTDTAKKEIAENVTLNS